MSIDILKKVLSRIAPTFEKNNLTDMIEAYRQEYNETIKKPLANAALTYRDAKIKHDEIRMYAERIERGVETKRDYSFIDCVNNAMSKIPAKLDMLERQIDVAFSGHVAAHAIGFDQATIMRYMDGIGFTLQYTRRLLLRTFQLETEFNRNQKDSEVRGNITYLQENLNPYIAMLNVLNGNAQKQESLIKEIPNITINDEGMKEAVGLVGINRVDPLNMGFLPPRVNPAFYVLRMWSDFQYLRYERAKEERDQLERRLLDYRDSERGDDNAQVQKAIRVHEDRIAKLSSRIRKFEESVE